MSLHYQSTNGLQGVVKTNKGIEIKNARMNVKTATSGFSFNGSDELENEWYDKQAGSDVDMGSNKITNLTDPTSAQEGATKNYVDAWSSKQAQSDVDMNSNKITNLGAPANPQDATSKNYVDSLAGTPALKDSLRAYYSFDGDYKDSTSNGYDGTGNNTTFTSGKINQAVDNSNSSAFVDVGNLFNWNSGDFSVSCWIYPNNSSSLMSIAGTYVSQKFTLFQYLTSEKFSLELEIQILQLIFRQITVILRVNGITLHLPERDQQERFM